MFHVIRTWLLWLTLLGVLLAHLLGEEAALWSEGGEGGTVNLPGASIRSPSETIAPRRSGDGTTYRTGYRMLDLAQGLKLNLPSNMESCTGSISIDGLASVTSTYSGSMFLPGTELVQSRDNGQLELSIVLATSTRILNVLVLLQPEESGFEVLVE